jgi:hypothetical protein
MPMPCSRARRRCAGRAAALVLLAVPGACRTWRTEPLPTAGAPARSVAARVRATRADGSRVELARARVAGDTLRGERRENGPSGRPSPVAVPLDSLRALEARRVSWPRTGALVVGALLAWFAVAFAALSAAGPGL